MAEGILSGQRQRRFQVKVDHAGDLARAAAVAPNMEEARGLTGMAHSGLEGAAEAARRLRERGPALVCLKLADGGGLPPMENDRRERS